MFLPATAQRSGGNQPHLQFASNAFHERLLQRCAAYHEVSESLESVLFPAVGFCNPFAERGVRIE